MDELPWFDEPIVEEEEPELPSIHLGTAQTPPGVNILTGVEMMVQDLNRMVREHVILKWNVLYGHLY